MDIILWYNHKQSEKQGRKKTIYSRQRLRQWEIEINIKILDNWGKINGKCMYKREKTMVKKDREIEKER